MSTLIPSIFTCKFDAPGERRFARLLEAKLEDDYLCWYNVPIGTKRLHPDFIIMHPRRGIIILEVKDWRLSTIQSMKYSGVATTHYTFRRMQTGRLLIGDPLQFSLFGGFMNHKF